MYKVEIVSDDEINKLYREFRNTFIVMRAAKIKTRTDFFAKLRECFEIKDYKGYSWDTFMEWLIKEPIQKKPIAFLIKDFMNLVNSDEDFRDEVIRMFNLVIIPYYESRPEIEKDGVKLKPEFRVFVAI